MTQKAPEMNKLQKANESLRRMTSAIGNNSLSGNVVSSEKGKTALAALLAESVSGDFRPDVARETIKKVMEIG